MAYKICAYKFYGGSEMIENVKIRIATPEDAENILAVYAPYVENTAITFEYTVPEISEFRQRIENTLKEYPYIVAEKNNHIIGYAYTGRFVGREAYRHSVEVSIYVDKDFTKSGIGKQLYNIIEKISIKQNVFNLNACIAVPETNDKYLTRNSISFHEHMGYKFIGEFHKCGYKFGRWYNMAWLEKIIASHPENPEPFKPFPEIDYSEI